MNDHFLVPTSSIHLFGVNFDPIASWDISGVSKCETHKIPWLKPSMFPYSMAMKWFGYPFSGERHRPRLTAGLVRQTSSGRGAKLPPAICRKVLGHF